MYLGNTTQLKPDYIHSIYQPKNLKYECSSMTVTSCRNTYTLYIWNWPKKIFFWSKGRSTKEFYVCRGEFPLGKNGNGQTRGRFGCPPPPLSHGGYHLPLAGLWIGSSIILMGWTVLRASGITSCPLFKKVLGNLPYPILLETAIIPNTARMWRYSAH